MRIRELESAVAAANPVGPERAAALPLAVLGEELLGAVAGEPLPRPAPRRPRPALRLAVALAACLLLTAATAFTSPGRAVTGWVGERIGFGEPGGPPSLRQFNEFLMQTNEGKPGSAHVLVVGRAPGDRSRYELIVYETKRRPDRRVPAGPCFRLDLTQARGSYGQGCGVLPKGGDLAFFGPAGNLDPDSGLIQVSGRVSPAVAKVEASFRGRPIPVDLRPVPAELVERFQLGTRFGFFIAFLPNGLRGGTVEVTARSESGAVLGHAAAEVFSRAPLYRRLCRDLKDRRHANPAALEDCRQVLGPRSEW